MKNNFSILPPQQSRAAQRGGAVTKMIIVLVVLILVGHAAFNYIPVAYQGEDYKQRMQETVTNAYAMPNTPNSPEAVTAKLRRFGNENGIPADAYIKVDKLPDNGLRAHVYFQRPIDLLPFGLYRHTYTFNHVAQPNSYLTK